MEDHEERADELEQEVDKLEKEGDRVEREIAETREESDQLPEEAPAEQVPDDAGGEGRDEAKENPGVPGEDERGTGHQPDEQSGDA